MTMQKKWDTDSTCKLQKHKRFTHSCKLWLNLCSFRWLSSRLNLVSNLKPLGSSSTNKDQSMVNYYQSSTFGCPYLLYEDHCGWWLFQKIFFLLMLFLFPRNSFEQSWTCFLESSTDLQNTKDKSFSFYMFIFYLLFHNHSMH